MACLREHYGDQINCRYVGRGKLPQKESVVVYLGNEFRTCLPRHCWTPMERGSSWTEFNLHPPRASPFCLERKNDPTAMTIPWAAKMAPLRPPAGGGDKPGASYEGDDERASASPRLALLLIKPPPSASRPSSPPLSRLSSASQSKSLSLSLPVNPPTPPKQGLGAGTHAYIVQNKRH